MIGVTFAIGPGWKECGEFAAIRMAETTGLRCDVISEWPEDPGQLVNPSWLKLWAQEWYPGEDLMLFDSDIVSMKRWDPVAMLDGYDFAFAREYVHYEKLLAEVQRLHFDPWRYGNCGLILIKAGCTVLEESRKYYPAYGTWLEQTGVNKRLQERPDLKVNLFPRAYNRLWPAYRPQDKVGLKHQVNLHFCNLKGNAAKLAQIQQAMTRYF